jgi:hypothetical protein
MQKRGIASKLAREHFVEIKLSRLAKNVIVDLMTRSVVIDAVILALCPITI